ncbi:hypothetical protein FB558_3972 [Pseudonocardia kunmingensis]|uniref:Uncharacterized protein n=1 Tax=Pseudonocardia kunmingensis TaxID=630975 RepID=A0A543DQ00_9PSEU|nr:hypothetical protein FB558_3972 [Pseudonocardia kunmingensis]
MRTEDYYRSLLANHIQSRWGAIPLDDITGLKAVA